LFPIPLVPELALSNGDRLTLALGTVCFCGIEFDVFRTNLGQMKELKPTNNNGSIQLKFTVEGKRYTFSPIPGGTYGKPQDMAKARAIASKIQLDRLSGHFDPTLNSYRLEGKKSIEYKKLLDLWDAWVNHLDLPPDTKADHYEMIRRMLLKAKPKLRDTSFLVRAKLAPSTYNHRLSYLKSCWRWSKLSPNPWESIKPKKYTPPKIKPFTSEEIKKLVEGFDTLAPHYSIFFRFLLLSGCRLSEAIGLRWSDIGAGSICIESSLSIDRTGNGYTRKRKQTKTGTVRHLNLSTPLQKLLEGIERRSDEFVFHAEKGGCMRSSRFYLIWKRVLASVGVEYRKPHTLRHTTLSMAIEQGIPITGVAYLAGHKDTRMVMTTYGHMINRPNLPDIDI
jgi:integrase